MTQVRSDKAAERNRRILSAMLIFLGIGALLVSAAAASLERLNGTLVTLRAEHFGPLFQITIYHGALGLAALASGLVMRRTRSVSPILTALILILLPFTLLVSTDRILNAILPPALKRSGIFRPHETRGWALLPNSKMYFGSAYIYIDRYGFRVPEDHWDRTVPPRPRILFVGDSLAFGLAIEAEKSYAELIGAAARAVDGLPDFSVINAGVTGYDIAQSLDQLRELEPAYQPDLIVQQICFNDITEQYDARHGRDEEKYPEYRYLARDPHWSAIVRLVFDWARRQRYGGETEQDAAEALQHVDLMRLLELPPSETVEAAWERVYEVERELIDFCRARQLPLAVVAFPIQQQFTNPDSSLDPQDRLAKFFSSTDIPFLDISSVYFEQYERNAGNGELLFVDDTHPTRLGHRIAADSIFELLRSNRLLEKAALRYKTGGPQ